MRGRRARWQQGATNPAVRARRVAYRESALTMPETLDLMTLDLTRRSSLLPLLFSLVVCIRYLPRRSLKQEEVCQGLGGGAAAARPGGGSTAGARPAGRGRTLRACSASARPRAERAGQTRAHVRSIPRYAAARMSVKGTHEVVFEERNGEEGGGVVEARKGERSKLRKLQ